MKNGKYEDYFPIDFALINKIIFTTSKFYEPNLATYFHYNKISDKELMDIIIDKLIDQSIKGNFDLIKNKDKKELIKEISKIINIQEICKKHFEINDTRFSCFNLDELENMFKKKNNKILFNNKLKYKLFNERKSFFHK